MASGAQQTTNKSQRVGDEIKPFILIADYKVTRSIEALERVGARNGKYRGFSEAVQEPRGKLQCPEYNRLGLQEISLSLAQIATGLSSELAERKYLEEELKLQEYPTNVLSGILKL